MNAGPASFLQMYDATPAKHPPVANGRQGSYLDVFFVRQCYFRYCAYGYVKVPDQTTDHYLRQSDPVSQWNAERRENEAKGYNNGDHRIYEKELICSKWYYEYQDDYRRYYRSRSKGSFVIFSLELHVIPFFQFRVICIFTIIYIRFIPLQARLNTGCGGSRGGYVSIFGLDSICTVSRDLDRGTYGTKSISYPTSI